MKRRVYNNSIPRGEYVMVEHVKNANYSKCNKCRCENFILPIASHITLGGVKIGSGLSIDSDGVLSVNSTGGTVNDGRLTITTTGSITGSGTFTANQAGNTTITLSAPTSLSGFTNDVGYISSESDPTVPSWVKGITISDINLWNTVGISSDAGNSLTLGTDGKVYYSSTPVVVNDGNLTLNFTGVVTETVQFSANQAADATATINIPATDLSGHVPTSRTITINGDTKDLTGDVSWVIPVPVVNDGVLNINTSGIATGSGTFTANQSSNENVTINVPGTDLTSFLTGGSLYIVSSTGAGTSVDLTSLTPSVGDGTLTLGTSGIATGSQTFTANQSGNAAFTVNVPGTNIGGNLSGSILNLTSSTGSGVSIPLTGIIPSVGNGTLTLNTSGIATGSQTFTANQGSNATFTVNVPPTNISGNLSGTTLNLSSSTGTGAAISLAGLIPSTPTLHNVTTAGNVTSNKVLLSGPYVTDIALEIIRSTNGNQPIQRWSRGVYTNGYLEVYSNSTGSNFDPAIRAYSNRNAPTLFFSGTGLTNKVGNVFQFRATGSTGSEGISSGNILLLQNHTVGLFSIDYSGHVNINNSLTITNTGTATTPLDIIRGNLDLNALQRWSRGSGGSLEVKSVSSGSFAPSLAAYNPDAGSNFTLQSYGKNDIGAGAAINLRAGNSANSGVITGGTVFRVSNWTTQLLNIDHNGTTTLSNLSGSGNRLVTASPTGELSASLPAPLSGIGSYPIASVPAHTHALLGSSTVTGAAVGDVVIVTQPSNALIIKGVVTAANTVSVYALNCTASPISTTLDPIKIKVLK